MISVKNYKNRFLKIDKKLQICVPIEINKKLFK